MTSIPETSGLSLLQRLAAIARHKPDDDALIFLPEGDAAGAVARTYAQLQRTATALATLLQERAEPGARVLLLLPADADYFAAAWGCLLAGMVVVPMAVPRQEAQFGFVRAIMQDSGATVVLTRQDVQASLQPLAESVEWLLLEETADVMPHAHWPMPGEHTPALLQYTSGSTGMPKGVVVTHGNLAASVDLMLTVANIDGQSTVVSWLPLFHNMGFISFGLLPLCVGARLVLMPTESFMLNPARWFLAISQFRGTHSGAPNIGYESCLNFLPDALLDKLDLQAWRVAAIGSEPLKASLIDRFAERFARCGFRRETFLTTYGFSEATVFSAGADSDGLVPRLDVDKTGFENGRVEPVQSVAKTLISVGRARDHVAIIHPDTAERCGERTLGEIWIQGPTVAAGYWNKPEATAATFNQFASDGSGPYVRSGDIGMVAAGNLYVVGRSKELIIVGGKKLHPLDIEQAVNGVCTQTVPYAAAASAWHTEQGERLALFQELKPDTAADDYANIVTQLCDTVHERFGVQLQRVVLLRMGSLPRTHNGKLQRIRCCELVDSGTLAAHVLRDWQAGVMPGEMAAAQRQEDPLRATEVPFESLTPTEQKLALLWAELLNRPSVHPDADFIGLGGQSIVATRMVALVRQRLGVELSLRAPFRHSTLRQLACHIDGLRACPLQTVSSHPDAEIAAVDGWLPLTAAQRRLWLLNRLDDSSAAYHMCASYELKGELDQAALTQTLTALVERHAMLRTVYRLGEGGVAQQRALQAFDFDLICHDLTALTPSQRASVLESLLQQSRTTPFDLTRDLPLRACLVRTAPDTHVLALTIHHIAADGWSVNILVRELATHYGAFSRGQAVQPGTTPPYAQWALRQEQMAALHWQARRGYWHTQLQDLPPLHSLPLDRPRRLDSAMRGETHVSHLDSTLLAELDVAARKQGVTLYMQLQTALAILLARLGTSTDVAIGAAYASREQAECQDIVGFFVNSLVIRHRLAQDQPVANVLTHCRDTVLDAYEQEVPFEQLVEWLNPPRVGQHNPLFQVMLNLQNKDNWQLDLPGLKATPFHISTQEAKFDLAVDCTQHDGGLSIQWEFDAQLFDRATLVRWSGYFERILQALCRTPDLAWECIALLDAEERQHLLQDFNRTEQPAVAECLHHLFERCVELRPDALALVCGDAALSYRDLNQHANRIAHALIALGAGPDARIAILMERSMESVVAMLAVLKSGAAYVPVDIAYPPARIQCIVDDAQPAVIIVGEKVDLSWMAPTLPVRTLTQLQSDRLHNPARTDVLPHHLAYLIYTSGSTGQPKGALLEHRQVSNLLSCDPPAPVGVDDCVAHCANIAFDAAVWEVWSALTQGARLAVMPPDLVFDPVAFCDALLRQHVTALVLTVALFNQYRTALAPALAQLNYCLIGGEPVDARAALDVVRNSPPRHLLNIYGPAETAVFVTTQEITSTHENIANIPLGRPLANTRIYVLDHLGEPVPTGVVGEICIAGAQVGRGYWNRPSLTAETFVADTLTPSHEGARLYRTGDLGRWRADGVLEFAGRRDFQVKIRGFRIEPGEIEQVLGRCEHVQDVAVVAQTDAAKNLRLVAYVVPMANMQQALLQASAQWTAALAAQLARAVPDYMLPAAWVVLPALPLTPHGKLDRYALPLPDVQKQARQWEAPRSEMETLLARAWQAVLGVAQVGRQDNFFALGGHSLLAVRVSEYLRERGHRLAVKATFNAATLAEAALHIQADAAHARVCPLNPITEDTQRITPDLLPLVRLTQDQIDTIAAAVVGGARNIQDIYPLSPLQEGILFHHLMTQEQDPYLLRTVLAFNTRAQLDAFVAALRTVIERHDILRTSIHWQQLEQPVQVVQRVAPLTLVEHEQPVDEARMLACLDQQRPQFDLRNGPLLMLVAAPTSAASTTRPMSGSSWLLGILAHHIIADNETLALVFADIHLLLQNRADALPPALPFRYFIAQQQRESQAQHEAFFRQQLGDFVEPAFMFDVHDTNVDRQQIRDASTTVGADITVALRSQARRQQVSVASLLHLAWGMVIGACSGRDDLVFGTVLSGRLQADADAARVPGVFINTLPVRVNLASLNVQDSLQQLHRELNALTAHEQAPLALAKRCSGVAAEVPLFNILLNCRHKPMQAEADMVAALAQDGMQILSMEERTHYPVTLCVDEQEQSLQLRLQTAPEIDPQRVLRYMETALQRLVTALEQHPDVMLTALSVVPAMEQQRVLEACQSTSTIATDAALLHQRFERQAQRSPDAIAVVHGRTVVSYQQLNVRANAIAHALLQRGVQPDDRVAVCLERGLDLVASLIGVLKACAAYVPLDPVQPVARLSFMLQDCQPRLLLTSREWQAHLSAENVSTLYVDMIEPARDDDPRIINLQPQHLAYVIYTSGSTGRPKGVQVEHRQVRQLFDATATLFTFNADDVWTLFHSCAFDFSVWEMWGALTTGARLVIVPNEVVRASDEFYKLICRENVTVLNQTPGALRALLNAQEHDPVPHQLRYVILGGEALEAHVIRTWQALNARYPTRLINMYGITEITVHGTFNDVTDFHGSDSRGLMGRPLPSTEMYILDAHMRAVPVGATGELYVAGGQLARGYWQRDELNRERFILHSIDQHAPLRLYRSGDLACWRSDGTLTYRGRNDSQVKIRGYRIECGEIETCLRSIDDVRDAVVVARGEQDDRHLVAYIVAMQTSASDDMRLRERLLQMLPDYMVPVAFVRLPTLPLTVNGKIDHRALPAPAIFASGASTDPPQGETEIRLAALWQELLGVRAPGRHAHFYALGGHSLLAVRLNNAIRREWDISLPLRTVFELATIASLAPVIDVARGEHAVKLNSEEYEEGVFD